MKSGDQEAQHQARSYPAFAHHIGDDEKLQIDKSRHYQDGKDYQDRKQAGSRHQESGDRKQYRSEHFYDQVTRGEWCAAISASSAQEKPAENGDILVPGNRGFAIWAKRPSRPNHRNLSRNAIDADVQERSDERTETETCGNLKELHFYCFAKSGSTSSQSR